jgi:hypothetical protein
MSSTTLLDTCAGVARPQPCLAFTKASHRATKDSDTRLTRRPSRRSSPSCDPLAMMRARFACAA